MAVKSQGMFGQFRKQLGAALCRRPSTLPFAEGRGVRDLSPRTPLGQHRRTFWTPFLKTKSPRNLVARAFAALVEITLDGVVLTYRVGSDFEGNGSLRYSTGNRPVSPFLIGELAGPIGRLFPIYFDIHLGQGIHRAILLRGLHHQVDFKAIQRRFEQ
jgi:hypothetical protein